MTATKKNLMQFMRVLQVDIHPRMPSKRIRYGAHRSIFRGRGFEFYETRPFDPMRDSLHHIMWHSIQDPSELLVREAVEEKEMPVTLLLDLSSSMSFKVKRSHKRRLLFDAAGSIGLTAAHLQDKVGLVGFTDKIVLAIPPMMGSDHVYYSMKKVLAFLSDPRSEAGQETDLAEAFRFVRDRLKHSGLIFTFSDFIGWEHIPDLEVFRAVAAKHEVVCVILDDPKEFDVRGFSGSIRMRDMEKGNVYTVPVRTLPKIRRELQKRREKMRAKLARLGVPSVELTYGNHLAELTGFLKERRKK